MKLFDLSLIATLDDSWGKALNRDWRAFDLKTGYEIQIENDCFLERSAWVGIDSLTVTVQELTDRVAKEIDARSQ